MKRRVFTIALFAVLVDVCCASYVVAQEVTTSAPIREGSTTTYLELLRKLMPDANSDGSAQKTIPIKSIVQPDQKTPIHGPIKFEFEPHWFNSDGKRLLLLRVEIAAEDANQGTPYEGEAVVLAVFAVDPGVKLLDALEIKTDRFTYFFNDQPLLTLNNQNDAFIVESSHSNAGESFSRIDLLFIDEGRLKSITNQFLFETQGCGITISEVPSFRTIVSPSKKYPDVLVRVKLTKEPDEPSCELRTRGYTRYYEGRYSWNRIRRRYEGRSPQLQTLDRFNNKRVSSP